MKTTDTNNFLISNDAGIELFSRLKDLPIIDYHNHLPIDLISKNINFNNISDLWINHDHYKWRAMRLNGISEKFCTGNGSDYNKFLAWAATVPYTIRNPLYHWTIMELKDYFDIDEILNEDNAKKYWNYLNLEISKSSFTPQKLLERKK